MVKELTLKQLFHLPSDIEHRLEDKTFVGIDFGTSTTVVSVAGYNKDLQQIECEPVELEQTLPDKAKIESYILPSVLAVNDEGKLLVGQGAYELKDDPNYIFGENIWYSFKMDLGENMGPKWTSITKKEFIKSPQDATTIFFRYLKKVIEAAVKEKNWSTNIQYAVSIPASFESNQRLDLLRALENNGIEMDGGTLIDEPNAAFIGYINPDYTYKEAITLKEGYNPKVLVFDFGAGTCDISILELGADYKGYHSRNISISQFNELGGNDIDRYIAYNFLLPNILKLNDIPSDSYTTSQLDIIAKQLMGIAEQLKILASRDFQYLLTDSDALEGAINRGQGITFKQNVSIYTDYGDLKEDVFFLSYENFMEAMHAFLNNKKLPFSKTVKRQKKYNSIYATINSAIKKAHIEKGEIDYVMMIGGSSKNPYVQKCIKEYFPKHTKILIPQNLQSLVSQGAALHSLLVNGIGHTVVKPITSEPIVLVLRGEQEITLIPAGTEIPITEVSSNNLSTGEQEQSTIEIPICVSNAEKVVANLKIEDPMGLPFPKHTPIELSLDMNTDKVLNITAKCLGQECTVRNENPFANTYLTDEEKKILEAERNTYISADNNNGIPSKQSLINLRSAFVDAGKEYQAAETCEEQIKYYPQDNLYNYIGVLYHNSGNYTKAIRFFEKAIEHDNTNVWALSNLGHDFYMIGKNEDAKKCLEKALNIKGDHTTALSKLGDIYRDSGDKEKAQDYYQQCFNIFMRKWKENNLNEVDYGWFENVAEKLGKADVAREIRDSRPKRHRSQSYNADNLITLENQEDKE
jgi:molecular chaperone DnaK (HSP70)